MKKMFGLLLVLCLVLVGVQASWAAATAVQTFRCYGKTGDVCMINIAWTAHTDGVFTWSAAMATIMATNIGKLNGYYFYEMETDPGGTAPAADYDITLTRTGTDYAYDILGGRGADRSATATQAIFPANNTGSRFVPVNATDVWVPAITNIVTASGNGVIRLWFVK